MGGKVLVGGSRGYHFCSHVSPYPEGEQKWIRDAWFHLPLSNACLQNSLVEMLDGWWYGMNEACCTIWSLSIHLGAFHWLIILLRGTNLIQIYTVNCNTHSLRKHDGLQHVIVLPDGKFLYSVTELHKMTNRWPTDDQHCQNTSVWPQIKFPAVLM